MLKILFRKIFPPKPLSMEEKIENYRMLGITIGDNCHIYSSLPSGRDCFLLNIGNNVTISNNVSFLQHDASIGTITNYKYTDILGETVIGDDCFIGYGSIILPGVVLAKGTIVGAGSVVTKSTDKENMVIAGNPAKYICSVEEYVEKNEHYFVNLDGMNKEDIISYLSNKPNKVLKKTPLE